MFLFVTFDTSLEQIWNRLENNALHINYIYYIYTHSLLRDAHAFIDIVSIKTNTYTVQYHVPMAI